MYEALQGEGYRVAFVRIPLTDGTCPLPRDFDTFYSAAAGAGPSDALIYTCQVGGGGVGWGGGWGGACIEDGRSYTYRIRARGPGGGGAVLRGWVAA